MNVVNFAEGILGIDKSASMIVAKCLRKLALMEETDKAFTISSVASALECGEKPDISEIREIGEPHLAMAQKLFLSL